MNLVTHPTKEHMAQLLEWLEAEDKETGEGFFCNWNIIYETYEKDRLLVVEQSSQAIALLSWWEYSTSAGINILTVKPNHRRKGIGRFLAGSFLEATMSKDVSMVKIQCQPTSSELFWLSLGFYEDPEKLCERINGVPMQDLYLLKELHAK